MCMHMSLHDLQQHDMLALWQCRRMRRFDRSLWVQCPFTFGVEIFEAGHCTTPHSHASAHELFFILAGARLQADSVRYFADAGDSLKQGQGSSLGHKGSPRMWDAHALPMRRCTSMVTNHLCAIVLCAFLSTLGNSPSQ